MNGKEIKMIVYLVEIRHKEYNEQYITASYERTQKELKEVADKPYTGVIVTRYEVEDLKEN